MVNLAEFAGIQSDEPIGPQPPIPGGVREMEVSLDTQSEPPKMRLVLPGGRTWYFKSLYGKAECIGADNETGRLYFRGTAQLIGDSKMVLRRAPDAEPGRKVGIIRTRSDTGPTSSGISPRNTGRKIGRSISCTGVGQ